MEPRISIITLGVNDLKKSTEFYEKGLGLPKQKNKEEEGNISFFELQGTWLALYPKDKLAEDSGVTLGSGGYQSFTLAHNVRSEAEADALLKEAEAAGAKIIKPAQKVFWGGYSGYFEDPDGYLWEVAYNPFFDLTK